jgi:hypothetical protein
MDGEREEGPEAPPWKAEVLTLLGAEGFSELGIDRSDGPAWIREATQEEKARFIRVDLDDRPGRFERLCVDPIGRPYFLVALRSDGPRKALELAHAKLRVTRLL